MKKLLILTAGALLAFSLISCGSAPKSEKSEEAKAPEAAAETTEKTEETETAAISEGTGEISLMDDFEDGLYWAAIGNSWGDGDQSLNADLSEDWGTEGPTSLKCDFNSKGDGNWQKSGFMCDSLLETNWEGARKVHVDINNPNDFDIEIGFVAQSGENWEFWNQTTGFACPAGAVTEVVLDISAFKGLSQVNRATIYLFGDAPAAGYFLADNLRIEF